MKVLFLDVDGVLNRQGTKERFEGFTGIDQELLDKFLTWRKDKPFEIVLASTWRLHDDFAQHLQDKGISWYSVTPRGNGRGREIKEWLDLHPDVTEFAILDDDGDMHPVGGHHAQTGRRGLEDKHLKACEILMRL